MNVIVYKLLFQNDVWNSNENITTLLIHTFSNEPLSIQNILFSSFLYHLEHNSDPLFSKKNKNNLKRPIKTKIQTFYSVIWKNPFLNDLQKEQLLLFFCKIQKIYYTLSRVIRIYKYKSSNIVVNQDLFLNHLDPGHRHTCIFFIHKSIYYFNVNDIWRILEKGWTNHSYFDLELTMPKNPYTNIPFTKIELYHYYFHRKKVGLTIPLLLEYFFLEEFNLSSFEIKHETFIYKYIIRKFVFDSTNKEHLFRNIMEMIEDNPFTCNWEIHRDFPKEKLVEIMRNYVYIYYLIRYGKLTENQFLFMSSFLSNALHLFWKYNPYFGKKKISFTNSKIVSFHEKHLLIKTRHL